MPRYLAVRSRISDVRSFDTKEQQFEIDVRVSLYWEAEAADSWVPEIGQNLVIQNALEDVAVIDSIDVVDVKASKVPPALRALIDADADVRGSRVFNRHWRFRATIGTRLTLHEFPCDSQRLEFAVRIPRVHRHGIRRVVCADAAVSQGLDQATAGMSVDLLPVATANVERSDRGKERMSIEDAWRVASVAQRIQHCAPGEENFKPEYLIEMDLRRRAAFYISNIAVPNGLLTLLHYCCFLYGTSDMNDRLSVVLTLLLALITLKAAVASFLPILPYETQLDVHTLVNIGLVVSTGFACVAIFMLDSIGGSESLSGLRLFAATWVAPHLPEVAHEWIINATAAQLLNAACGLASLLVFSVFNACWFAHQLRRDLCRRKTKVAWSNVDC